LQPGEAATAAAKAQIQVDQSAVEAASINLAFTRIDSPIDGIVGIPQAQVGDLVSISSGALTAVSTLDPIRDQFTVSEQEYLELGSAFQKPTRVDGNCSSYRQKEQHILAKVNSILPIAR
jgi:multidrug efflux pump subunit AcrA (membrane-fusion protein)